MSRTEGDRPLFGILLMTGFCILAPFGDSIAKLLGDTIPLIQLLFVRFALQALFLLPLVWWARLPMLVDAATMRLVILRTVLHLIGVGAMFTSLRYLPLADAVAIAFVMPILQLLLGHFVLGEEVGRRRLAACCVGFIGTLMVIQPSFAEVGLPALLPLLVAVVFSTFILITRQISRRIDPIGLQAVSGLMAMPMLGIALLLLQQTKPDLAAMVHPTTGEAALLVAIGVTGTLAHLLMTWSLRYAPSTTLAPMQYLEIPFATFLGWLIFDNFPNGLAALGIAVTIGAGLYIVLRERRLAQNGGSQ